MKKISAVIIVSLFSFFFLNGGVSMAQVDEEEKIECNLSAHQTSGIAADATGSVAGGSLDAAGSLAKGAGKTAGDSVGKSFKQFAGGITGNGEAFGNATSEVPLDNFDEGKAEAKKDFQDGIDDAKGDLKEGIDEIVRNCDQDVGTAPLVEGVTNGAGDVAVGAAKGTADVASGTVSAVSAGQVNPDEFDLNGFFDSPLNGALAGMGDLFDNVDAQYEFCLERGDGGVCSKDLKTAIGNPFEALSLFIVVAGLMVGAIRVMAANNGEPLAELATSLLNFALVYSMGALLLGLFTTMADALAYDIIFGMQEPDLWRAQVAENVSDSGWFLKLIVGLALYIALIFHSVGFFAREVSLIFLSGLLVFAASGQLFKSSRSWLPKILSVCFAILFYKVAVAFIMFVSLAIIGPSSSIIMILASVAAITFAPLSFKFLYSLFGFLGDSNPVSGLSIAGAGRNGVRAGRAGRYVSKAFR